MLRISFKASKAPEEELEPDEVKESEFGGVVEVVPEDVPEELDPDVPVEELPEDGFEESELGGVVEGALEDDPEESEPDGVEEGVSDDDSEESGSEV